jgi:hypothetical protein
VIVFGAVYGFQHSRTHVRFDQMQAGQCVANLPGVGERFDDLKKASCDQPHLAEVLTVSNFSSVGGEIDGPANTACQQAASKIVVPDPQAWQWHTLGSVNPETDGTFRVACVVTSTKPTSGHVDTSGG